MNDPQHPRRTRAVIAAGALLGSGLVGLAIAPSANAAVTAQFAHGLGVLTILGDGAGNTIAVSRDVAGQIEVDGGHVDIHGATATVDNVRLIRVFGGAGDDTITLDESNGALPRAELSGGAGDDRLTGGSAADRLSGDAGDDTLIGGRGNEVLIGGDGNDFVDGNQGADVALLGAGDDVFQWDPGDGSDTVEGGDGRDTMLFNGANIGETFDVSANAGRVSFTRSVGGIVMDLNGVERIDTRALGGADAFTVHDLSGTDVTDVRVDEEALGGGGDGSADRVTVFGTGAADAVTVTGSASDGVAVRGLSAAVEISGTDATLDGIHVDAAGGDDFVTAAGLASGVVLYSADGGDGNDVLVGSAGDDVLSGGAGDDVLEGGPGFDQLDGGAGANVLVQ